MKAKTGSIAIAFSLLSGLSFSMTTAGERPNILYFYVDDLGWGSLGPNGQAERRQQGLPYVKTPHLDELAARGINFTRSYGCTVCSPARSSQQTGFHQGHTYADRNDPDNAKKAMRAEDLTMGDLLSVAGYATGYWGKWGYGGTREQVDPSIVNIQTLPTSHGYQHVLAELHHVRAHTFFQPTLWSAPAKPDSRGGLELIPNTLTEHTDTARYPDDVTRHHHPDYPDIAYCDDYYCFAALDFIREQAKRYHTAGDPFFGLLAVQIPHAPFQEIAKLPGWDDAYADEPWFDSLPDQAKQWAAMVTRIDAHFGMLLAALEDPNGDGDSSDSVADNTLVLFMSDNGGPKGASFTALNSNGGLQGHKGSIREGGIRVPTLLSWPAALKNHPSLKAGSDSHRVIDVSDWLPTFCELAAIDAPVGLDGVSLAPLISGKGNQRPREFLIHEAGRSASIIRGKWKLVRSARSTELFDLDSDSAESNNVAGTRLELVKELDALLTGEKVDEPRGFANTYHRWMGPKGGNLSDATHWSDYSYENEGIVYMEEKGAPDDSWIGRFEGGSAVAHQAITFLGLEIAGGGVPGIITVPSNGELTGRNEIRIAAGGRLKLNGGKAASLRWIDVRQKGLLTGRGTVDATVYNQGTVEAQTIKIKGDYIEDVSSQLVLGSGEGITIDGTAHLAGRLVIHGEPNLDRPILRAGKVNGQFSNSGRKVTAPSGEEFVISTKDNAVFLKPGKR